MKSYLPITAAIILVACNPTQLIAQATDSVRWSENYTQSTVLELGSTQSLTSTNGGTVLNFTPSRVTDGGTQSFGDQQSGGYFQAYPNPNNPQGGAFSYMQIGFNNSEADPEDRFTAGFEFNRAVTGLSFSLLDIDSTSTVGVDYDDAVQIFINGELFSATSDIFTLTGNDHTSIDNNSYMDGFEGIVQGSNYPEAQPSDSDANIIVDLGNIEVTSFAIEYFSTDEANDNPNSQYMAIGDFSFDTTTVPEPSSALLAALGLLRFMRRQR